MICIFHFIHSMHVTVQYNLIKVNVYLNEKLNEFSVTVKINFTTYSLIVSNNSFKIKLIYMNLYRLAYCR